MELQLYISADVSADLTWEFCLFFFFTVGECRVPSFKILCSMSPRQLRHAPPASSSFPQQWKVISLGVINPFSECAGPLGVSCFLTREHYLDVLRRPFSASAARCLCRRSAGCEVHVTLQCGTARNGETGPFPPLTFPTNSSISCYRCPLLVIVHSRIFWPL